AAAGTTTRLGRTRGHHAGVGFGRHVSGTRPAIGFGTALRRRTLATGLLLSAPLLALLATGTLGTLPLSRRTGTDTEGIVTHARPPRSRLRAGFRTLGLGGNDTRTTFAGIRVGALLLGFRLALRRIRGRGRLLVLLAGRRSGLLPRLRAGLRPRLRAGFRAGLRRGLLLTVRTLLLRCLRAIARSRLLRGSRHPGAVGRAAGRRRLRTRCPALRLTGR